MVANRRLFLFDIGLILVYILIIKYTDRRKNMRRTSITVPSEIDKIVEEYQSANGITTWIAALYELARKGYESSKK